jgi:very-short-patch-repair endonuclease
MKKHPAPGAHARARTLRSNMTEAERRIWQILRSEQMQGHKFRRQVPIGRYIADFVCHKARLVIEIDGGQHERSSLREIGRSAFLQHEGYRVLRFWNNEVLTNLEGVYATIAEALDISPIEAPRHAPSPLMGEGRGGGEASLSPPSSRERAADITPTQTLPHQGGGLLRSETRR